MIKRIIKVIVGIVLFVIISFNIYNFINIKVLKNDYTTINGYAMLEVISGSMEPTIKIGDLIIIDTKDKDYKVNDIVTFRDTNGNFVTHRIVELKDNNMMVTKGDYNNSKDEAISMKNIVGKYIKKIAFLGMLLSSFKNPVFLVVILLIGILYCYIISTDDKGRLIEYKKEKKKTSKKKTSKKDKKDASNEKTSKKEKKEQEDNDTSKKDEKEEEGKDTTKKVEEVEEIETSMNNTIDKKDLIAKRKLRKGSKK